MLSAPPLIYSSPPPLYEALRFVFFPLYLTLSLALISFSPLSLSVSESDM
jgi:hypothetical protein